MSAPEQLGLLDWRRRNRLASSDRGGAPPPIVLAASPRGPSPIHLTRVEPSHNKQRFYSLALATSLWGEHSIVRGWGRIGTTGQSRTDWYENPEVTAAEFERMAAHKWRQGYR